MKSITRRAFLGVAAASPIIAGTAVEACPAPVQLPSSNFREIIRDIKLLPEVPLKVYRMFITMDDGILSSVLRYTSQIKGDDANSMNHTKWLFECLESDVNPDRDDYYSHKCRNKYTVLALAINKDNPRKLILLMTQNYTGTSLPLHHLSSLYAEYLLKAGMFLHYVEFINRPKTNTAWNVMQSIDQCTNAERWSSNLTWRHCKDGFSYNQIERS